MDYQKLIDSEKEKFAKEKLEFKKKQKQFKEKIKKLSIKLNEEKKFMKSDLKERKRVLLFKAQNILNSPLSFGKDNYVNLLDDGNLVGIYNGEIFYTKKKGKKSYLYLEKIGVVAVNVNKDSSSNKDCYRFTTSRVEFSNQGCRNPFIDFRQYDSLIFNEYFCLYKSSEYYELEKNVLSRIPKEFVQRVFELAKEKKKFSYR